MYVTVVFPRSNSIPWIRVMTHYRSLAARIGVLWSHIYKYIYDETMEFFI